MKTKCLAAVLGLLSLAACGTHDIKEIKTYYRNPDGKQCVEVTDHKYTWYGGDKGPVNITPHERDPQGKPLVTHLDGTYCREKK